MATKTDSIQILDSKKGKVITKFKNFILSHQGLANQPYRVYDYGLLKNPVYFLADLGSGKLRNYSGSFVAYHHGVFCGSHDDGTELFEKAGSYYGGSSLSVFKVPGRNERLKDTSKLTIGADR